MMLIPLLAQTSTESADSTAPERDIGVWVFSSQHFKKSYIEFVPLVSSEKLERPVSADSDSLLDQLDQVLVRILRKHDSINSLPDQLVDTLVCRYTKPICS